MSTEVTLRSFDLPLRQPLTTATGEIRSRRGFAIRLRTPNGLGVGEATPLPGWTESHESCQTVLENIRRDPPDRPEQLTVPDGHPAARHGLQLAALDYTARQADASVARYLGGPTYTETIPVNATISNGNTDKSVEDARDAVARGFDVIKCKAGGRPVAEEEDRLRAIRDCVGPHTQLRIDANQSWSVNEATELWSTFEAINVEYVEEPLNVPRPEGVSSLQTNHVGIALDETLVHEADTLEPWLPVIDAAIIKPMAWGGICQALEGAIECIRAGVTPVVSGTIDGVIGRTAAAHLAAALPNPAPAGLATGSLLADDLAVDPLHLDGGTITIPDQPGLGTLGPWGLAEHAGGDE